MSNQNTPAVISSGYSSTSNTTLNQTDSSGNNQNMNNVFSSFVTGGNANMSNSSKNGNGNDNDKNKSYESKLYSSDATNIANNMCNQQFYSDYNKISTEKLSPSYVNDEKYAYEVLSKAGPAYTYQRKDYSHDITALQCDSNNNSSTSSYQDMSSHSNSNKHANNQGMYEFDEHANVIKIEPNKNLYSSSAASTINQDPDPITVRKANNQNIVYKQQVNIRYLQPPTPPPPAPIIIREKQCAPQPALPPIIIRQTAPAPATPPPLTIREKAPTPPSMTEPTIIERPVPGPPAPPRQVIIERVPAPPAKPRPIIYEKWLPYKSTKRPVIVQKVKQQPPAPPPKNIIIEYEKPKAVAIRQVIEEGIFRVDPATYQNQQSNGEIRFVDRITDLPIENSSILAELCLDSNSGYKRSDLTNETDVFTDGSLQSALPNLLDSNFFNSNGYSSNSSSTTNNNTNSSSFYQNVEYEEIKTAVPESVANKIIAEAQAAGAISRSEKANYQC